jgi:uncharacterized zinc-type alcohol dehydrogenase-like protein
MTGAPRTAGYAATGPTTPLEPFTLDRREPRPHDVLVDILYCGVCHSDIHQARDEWGGSIFPMVPGHEIVGTVVRTGTEVRRWKAGDTVGVGVFVDSCRECEACRAGEEQYCEREMTPTYNGYERDGSSPTYGGYSENIVVDEKYVLRIPQELALDATAPLMCAGITTYSPIRHFGVQGGERAAVVGLGGLGHMAVKFLDALGAEVTVLMDGRSSTATVPPGTPILDAAQRIRPDLPFACKGGVCGTCRALVVDGQVTMRRNYALEQEEVDAGYVLTCQALPTSDQITVDYDA